MLPPPATVWRIAAHSIVTCLLLLVAAAAGPPNLAAAPSSEPTATSEYELKAVFILNFTRFVEWPATAFPQRNSPIVIGVIGENPFGSLLRSTVRGELVGGRPLVVQEFTGDPRPGECHVLFVSQSEQPRLRGLLASLRGAAVLTVSEIDGFCQAGGMIHLGVQQENVRFAINPQAATAAGLRLSAKLLRLAPTIATQP